MQPNVRASIGEFISYAHTSVNEVSYCNAPSVITALDIFSDIIAQSPVLLHPPGECQVPAEREALQLHHPQEFPGVYEALWQPAGQEAHGADSEDGTIREWPPETAVYSLTGHIQ